MGSHLGGGLRFASLVPRHAAEAIGLGDQADELERGALLICTQEEAEVLQSVVGVAEES
jgi:hypothetical protein